MRNATSRAHDAGLPERLRARDKWLGEIAADSQFSRLFDLLPGVFFFAKDRAGRMMYASRNALDLYGISDEGGIIGMTDFDLNPATMAREFVSGDDAIYATGEPILNQFELWFDTEGVPDWYVVSKLPIRSKEGEIIGIMGMLQSQSGHVVETTPIGPIAAAVARIRADFAKPLGLQELARAASLSPRQFQRKFRETLGLSPRELLIKTRVLAASRALRESGKSLAEIALTCGFCDQSSFTQHFRKHTGLSPARFREAARGMRRGRAKG